MQTLAILMATYNGEAYLKDQIDSLINQTWTEWKLYICDDFSTDSTVKILDDYVSKDSRIHFFRNDKNLGVIKNFEKLLSVSDADYYMFCDQDDVWYSEKIELSLKCMKEIELSKGIKEPIYVFSDVLKVNSLLDPLPIKRKENRPYKISFNRLLVKSVIPGCVSIFNDSLKKKVLPFPNDIILHDYWMALVASSIGTLEYLPIKLIYYRHHGSNVTAVKKRTSYERFLTAVKKIAFNRAEIVQFLKKERRQAKELYHLYNEEMNEEKKDILNAFIIMEDKTFILRKFIQIKYSFYRNTMYDNFELFIRM